MRATGTIKWIGACALALGSMLGLAQPAAAADIFVNADITVSETWTADNEYILQQIIYVTDGATLTIEPGTVIRGETESAPGAHDPGTLVITRGSKLRALGNLYHPVVFTDLDDDNIGLNPGTPPYDTAVNALGLTGRWGGVILLGYGYVANNTAATASQAREVQIEGLDDPGSVGFYGNCASSPLAATNDCDDDDSGEMRYVSIRYGGFNLSANNEINGLTLGGVGRETDLNFIEVFQNKDDGVEFFGGAANVKNVAIVNPGDDSVDYDEGWRGKGQFLFAMQGVPGTDRSDKAGEHDGGNGPDQSLPLAIPAIFNATYIGLGQNWTDNPTKATNTVLHLRDNAGGRYYNSFFGDFGGAAALIEGACGEAGTSGERTGAAYVIDNKFHIGPPSQFQLELRRNVWWCLGAELAGTPLVPVAAADAVVAGGSNVTHCNPGAGLFGGGNNTYLGCAAPLPIRTLTRTLNPNPARPDPITLIDPRPAAGPAGASLSGPIPPVDQPPADGFYMPASYKGAFAPTSDGNWLHKWSTMHRLDYFPPKPQVPVSGNIGTSTTWTADNEYVLQQIIYVTNGATLTIEPGTVVRGEMESAPGVHDPGTLVITRGSKIRALGTPYLPVVFTDLNDDNIGANHGTPPYDTAANALGLTGRWGGVILLGYGYVANNTAAMASQAREVQIEGLDDPGSVGFYGNCASSPLAATNDCDDDDSGEMRYVSIRYGGFNLSANNEINGLTLGGVGRETDLNYIEVFQNKDDGVEFFGGAANVKYFIMANGGDDSVDYDEGWRGKGQFLFAMQGVPGTDRSDKAGEHDGGNGPDQSLPRAIPAIFNATYVGLGQNWTDNATKATNTVLHLRDNAGGRYFNSFFADFGGAAALIEGACGEAGTSGERAQSAYVIDGKFHIGPPSQFELQLEDNCWWCLGAELAGAPLVPTAAADAAVAGGSNVAHCNPGAGLFAASTNEYLSCGSPLPIRKLERVPNPNAARPDPVISIDPRPTAASGLLGGADIRPTPADGFYMPAPYKGAFHSNWAAGYWTAMSRLGYFPTCDPVMNPQATPDEVLALRFDSKTHLFWEAQPFNTRGYDVLVKESDIAGPPQQDADDFGDAICLEELDFDEEATLSATPAASQVYFVLVRAVNDCGEGTLGVKSNGGERTTNPEPDDCP